MRQRGTKSGHLSMRKKFFVIVFLSILKSESCPNRVVLSDSYCPDQREITTLLVPRWSQGAWRGDPPKETSKKTRKSFSQQMDAEDVYASAEFRALPPTAVKSTNMV